MPQNDWFSVFVGTISEPVMICWCGKTAQYAVGIDPHCKKHAKMAVEWYLAGSYLQSEMEEKYPSTPAWWPVEFLWDSERTCDMPDDFRQTPVSYKTARCIYCDQQESRCVPRTPGRVKGFICQPCAARRDKYAGVDGHCPVCGTESPIGTGGRKRIYCDRHIRRNSNIRRYPAGASLLEIVERDGWQCHLCSKPITDLEDATRDHLVPKSHGGSDEPDNLAAAHMLCNSRRRTRPLEHVIT